MMMQGGPKGGPPPGMMMIQEGPGGLPDDIPIDVLKQLFPPGQVIIEEDDGPRPPRKGRPPPGVDSVIEDLMREMDESQQQAMEMIPRADSDDSVVYEGTACSKEIKAHCRDAKSQLHCLGKYNAEISDGRRADIGHSLPFLCSDAIDNFCDVLMGGILSCLNNQINNLQGSCKDAVVATKKVIQKVKSKKSPKAVPKPKVSLSSHEANLDAKLSGMAGGGHVKAKAPPPPPPPLVPHLQEKLLDHDIQTSRGKKEQDSSQASPPFMAVFCPLCVLLFGAYVVQRSSSMTANTMAFKNAEANDARQPLRTNSGMELLNPGGRYDLNI